MPASWYPWKKAGKHPSEPHYNRSLAHTILAALLLLSLIPPILIGTLAYIHTRDLQRKQTASQAESITQMEAGQIDRFAARQNEVIDRLATDEKFKEQLFTLVTGPDSSAQADEARAFLLSSFQAYSSFAGENYLAEMLIFSADNQLLLTTNEQWADVWAGEPQAFEPLTRELVGKNRSFFASGGPITGAEDGLALFTARSFVDDQGRPAATLIAAAPAGPFIQILEDARSLIPGSYSFFFDQNGRFVSAADTGGLIRAEQPGLAALLSPLTAQTQPQQLFSARLQDGTPVSAFARWLPAYNIGVLLAVPEGRITAQAGFLGPFNILVIGFAFILAGGVVYAASAYLVRPIAGLADAASQIAQGNRPGRIQMKRNDEIGLLAHAFNHIADRLSSRGAFKDPNGEGQAFQPPLELAGGHTLEISLLFQAAQMVTQARSESEIIQVLAKTFIQLPHPAALLSAEDGRVKIHFLTDPEAGRVEKTLPDLNITAEQISGLLAENRAVLIEDLAQPNEYESLLAFIRQKECVSAGLVPVLSGGKAAKIIVLGARSQNQINKASLQAYTALSDIISAGLEKMQALQALQKRLTELQILASFSQSISAETDLNNLYRELHVQVIQTFGPELEFGVALYNREKNLIEFPYYFEKGAPISIAPFPLGRGLTSMLLQSREPILLPDQESIQKHSGIQVGEPAKSWMGIPLIFAGEIIGAVVVQDLANENRFTQDDLNMLATLAPQIAISVRNSQLFTETQQALRAYDEEHFLINTLLDNMPEGIAFKDTEGRYIRASSSVARPLNLSPEELIGKTDRDLMDEEAASSIFQEEQRVLNSGIAEIGLIRPVIAGGEIKAWIHTSRIPIYLPTGEPYGLLVIQRDITELKRAEALAQQRANQVTIAAEITRDATSTLEVDTLLQKATQLINERFGFYQASIFLVDAQNKYAVLRESAGPAGQQMLRAGHRLAVGSNSIVGQVTAAGKAIIINDVSQSPIHYPNPLLPDTRSELAIPLIAGERLLGALDVQSTQVNAFNDEDVNVLQILADQIAVALVIGELFARMQELLGKHRLLHQVSIAANTGTNLQEILVAVVSKLFAARAGERIAILMLDEEGVLRVQASAGYEGTRHLELRIALGQGITGQAAAEKQPILVDNTLDDPRYISTDQDVRSELAIPILFNEELLGVLNLESTQIAGFDENDLEIFGALGNNLGAVIANIRLINRIRQQVIRERQLFEITSKIRRSVDMETILETSAKEVCRALGARRAKIHITAGSEQPAPGQPAFGAGPEDKSGAGNGRDAGRRG